MRKSPTPTDSKLRAILSLDWENRIEAVSEIWAEFPVLLAERFDYIWETNEGIQERSKSRLEAAYNSSYENLPPTSMISWAEETFEFVFQEVLAGIFTQITDEEEIAFVKNVIGSKVLSAVHLQIANYHSRVPRPLLVLPSKQVSSLETVEPLTESGQYNGWYRCGYFEDELLINEETRGFNGVLRIMEGIEFHDDFSLISPHPPFAQTNGDYWWENGEWQINPAEFNGPMTGLDLRKDLLGILPMLVLHPAISTALKLESQNSWQSPLVLYDVQGDVAVRFRCWHVRPIGSSIDLENVRLEGCDLIVRPDLFENLVKQIGKPYRTIRIVLPDKT